MSSAETPGVACAATVALAGTEEAQAEALVDQQPATICERTDTGHNPPAS